MIVNVKQNEAQVVGDIKQNRVGIDAKNIDFIAVLLTSNLYSQPIASFLRETISNAYDSHREAGTKEPILMLLEGRLYDSLTISIRDYGTGVSPERFEQIYRNIGSSTKRESNDFIGMFGIGRFSVLSCSDVANITSYYDGTKYSYIMYKNNGGINIDKIEECPTNQKNGLEVSTKLSSWSRGEVENAIRMLSMFRNLHIECNCPDLHMICKKFNERKVHRHNNFLVCDLISGQYFKVGNVLYPANFSMCNTKLCTSDIIIELPMGSVDITPNREALQYSEFTKKSIDESVKRVVDDLTEISKDCCKSTDLPNYYAIVDHNSFILRVGSCDLWVNKSDINFNDLDLTIDGEKPPKDYNVFIRDVYWKYPDVDMIYKCISSYRRYKSAIRMSTLLSGDISTGVKVDTVTKAVTVQYYREKYPEGIVVFFKDGIERLKKSLKKQFDILQKDYDVPECIEFTFKHLKIINVSNADVPADYVESYKLARKPTTITPTENYELSVRRYTADGSFHNYQYKTIKSFMESIDFGIYDVNSKDDEGLRQLSEILSFYEMEPKKLSRFTDTPHIITVKSRDIQYLENRKKLVHLNDFMYLRNKFWSKMLTAKLIYDELIKIPQQIRATLPICSEFKRTYHRQLRCIVNCSRKSLFITTLEYYKQKGWYNKAEVEYFTLTPKEKQLIAKIEYVNQHKERFISETLYREFGVNKRLGIHIPHYNMYKTIRK